MTSQYMILNKILNTKDISIITLNNLTEKHFTDYKAEFLYIMNHYNQYRIVPDKLTFASVFPDFKLIDVNEPDIFLVSELLKEYNTAYIAEAFNTVRDLYDAEEYDKMVKEVLNISDGLRVGSALESTDIIQDTSRFDRYVERCENAGKYFISTGLQHLDKYIGGIDLENENMVIIARTGRGKTWFLLLLAAAAYKQGLRVGIYSGEMTTDKVAYRIDTLLGHMNNRSISRDDKAYVEIYRKYIEKLPTLAVGTIKVVTPNDIAGEPTVDMLKAFIEKDKLDILFVDQYSLLVDTTKGTRSENERIANISKAIKRLQVQKLIPIISVSQQNRTKIEEGSGASGLDIDTSQVYGSDRIGQDATILLGLDRVQNKDNGPMETLNISIVKARDGGDGNKLSYRVNLNEGYFEYLPDSNNDSEADLEELQNSFEPTEEERAITRGEVFDI